MEKINKILFLMIKIFMGPILTIMLVITAEYYKKEWRISNVVFYCLCFIVIPAFILLVLRKHHVIKWSVLIYLVVFVVLMPYNYYRGAVYNTYDYNVYHNDSTDFATNSKTFMPTEEEVLNNQLLFFHMSKEVDKEHKMIRISLTYSLDNYSQATQKINNLNHEHLNKQGNVHISFDGIIYNGIWFYNNKDYVFAYSLCDETNTIHYLFFEDDNLQYMTPFLALKSKYGESRVCEIAD